MLAPDYLDHAPDRLVLLWQQVEDDILRDVARRIRKMETLTPTANWQLWRYQQVEAVRQDVVKLLARYTGKSEAEIRRLMQQAATRAMEAEDEIYYHYGLSPTPFAENETLQALLNAGYQQTAGTFANLTATTANTVSGQFEAATGYGTGAGLCGWNCRHTFFAIFPELGAPPAWTQESLEALNARDIEYSGKKYTQYEISQMQRARERTVRKYKRRYLAETEAGVDTTASAVKLRQSRQELADFISATGGRADSARTSVAGFGRSEARRATWAAKGYEKQQKDVIIIENLRTAAKLPKAAVIHLKPTAINVDSLTFDDAHVNQERSHNISEKQAKQYIRDAKISVTVWNGQFERYYGTEGSAYVRTGTNEIRTAYSSAEYTENLNALIEEMKKNGLLG